MNAPRRTGRRARRAPGGRIVPALIVLCLSVAAVPWMALGQEVGGPLVQREDEYRAALAAYEAAIASRAVQLNDFLAAVDSAQAARARGDRDGDERWMGVAYGLSPEVRRMDQRVQAMAGELTEARAALLGALDERLTTIEVALGSAPNAAARARLETQARDLRIQYQQLEDQGSNVLTAQAIFYPRIEVTPRDGPLELLAKAQLAERKVQQAERQLDLVDRAIQRVESLRRIERTGADFRGSLDRFGDASPPVGSPGQGRERDPNMVRDTVGVRLEDLPLADRLTRLRLFREQLETIVTQLRDQADKARARLPKTEEAAA